MEPVYRSGLTDSRRWREVPLRPDDVIISAPSKCGTTWLQMMCALLIFRTPSLPAPLTTLSPWVDMRARPIEELLGVLVGQRHRRFLKTHTPLDGLPEAPGVTYVVIGRDARDVAVSMDFHRANLDSARISSLLGLRPAHRTRSLDRRSRVLDWFRENRPPTETLDSLRAVVAHLDGAWKRRDEPSVVLFHYANLLADLEGQMRRLADRLGLDVPAERWPELVQAARFEQMRARAGELAPDERLGLFNDRQAFFRSGSVQQWRDVLTAEDNVAYERRLRTLAGPELAAWLSEDTGTPRSDGVLRGSS
jgi:aryl sulfotransferase